MKLLIVALGAVMAVSTAATAEYKPYAPSSYAKSSYVYAKKSYGVAPAYIALKGRQKNGI